MNDKWKQVVGFNGTEDGMSTNSYLPRNRNIGGETILIVDDERAIRNICSLYLTKKGYQTMLSETGEEALEIFRNANEKIDLVLLDLNMPGIGGANGV